MASSAAAHEVGGKGLPNQGRIAGKPDVIRIGDLTFRFLFAREEYEIREPGKPVSFMHADFPTPMSAASGLGTVAAYGSFTKMPAELQDDPVCRTSGHRVIPVWTHRPGQPALDGSKLSFIRDMIKRMNWKVVNQTAGTSRELQMAVDCNGAGEINVLDLTTADRSPATVFPTMETQLGDPENTESVKYLAFDYESDPGAGGYGRVYSGTGKSTSNPNNWFTSYAVVYATSQESYATVHELLHTMGASQGSLDESQPYSTTGLHCVDGVDILCYADGSTSIWGAYAETRCAVAENDAVNDPIDCGKDTYFNPVPGEGSWLATHWNVAGPENGFLVAKPKVTRLAPTSVTQTSATIRGSVHPEGAPTTYRIEYGPTKSYGSTWPMPDAKISGTDSAVTVTKALTGLEAESIYHYRVVAVSDGGTVYGQDEVFTTKAYTPTFLGFFGGSGSGSGELDNPAGITVDGEGDIWVADRDNNRIVQFNRKGEYLSGLGSVGSGNGQFNHPEGVAIGAGGKVFVADTGNKRVQYFTEAGSYLGQFGTTELQKLKEPVAIESTTGGSIWVADAGTKKMMKYSEVPGAGGNYLQAVIGGESLLTHPNGFGIDSGGDLWIADSGSDEIEVLYSSGLGKSGFDTPTGSGDGEVQNPFDVAFKATGSFFVADTDNNRIQQFSTATLPEAFLQDRAELLAKFGGKGSAEGQFLEPRGVAAGPNGTVYVSDSGNSRVQRWGQRTRPEAQTNAAVSVQGFGAIFNGTVGPSGLSTFYHFEYGPTTSYGTSAPVPDAGIGAGVEPVAVSKAVTGLQPETLYHYRIAATNAEGTSYGKDQTFLTTPVYSHLSTIGSPGTGNGQFKRPLGMDTDSSGNVWVVDRENNRLQKFNSEGEYLTQIGTKGSALGQFNDPRGVAIDAEGNLWVTEAGNQRIQKLSPGGPGLLQIKESLLGNPWLSTPSGITIGGDGNIYITDQGKQNVQKYSPTPDQFGNRHLISWSGYLNPTQMATDPQGDVWFVEFQEAGVYEVGSNYLVPEKRFGTKGSGIGQLLEPYGIAIKPSGNILITERGNNRVEQFSPSGGYLTQFGSKGTGVGQFTEPTGITVTQGGAIFVSDAGNNRIQLWEPK